MNVEYSYSNYMLSKITRIFLVILVKLDLNVHATIKTIQQLLQYLKNISPYPPPSYIFKFVSKENWKLKNSR